jgi:hypothetical protein
MMSSKDAVIFNEYLIAKDIFRVFHKKKQLENLKLSNKLLVHVKADQNINEGKILKKLSMRGNFIESYVIQ